MKKLILTVILSALILAGCGPERGDEPQEETNAPVRIGEAVQPENDPRESDSGKEPVSELPPEKTPEEQPFTEEPCAEKPVIYLYPEAETAVSVSLDYDGRLTCTYPAYENGWNVSAAPDGTLTDEAGQTYRYLYWEGEGGAVSEITSGFSVKGCETAAFLEDALAKLGLNRAEANEFIVYWLPRMQDNAYNLISFDTADYEKHAPLTISPEPDTVIRVFMTWTPAEEPVDLAPEKLSAPERTGFTVVEWGGSRIGG